MKWKDHYKTVFKIQRNASYVICINSTFFVPEPYKCFKKNLVLCVRETDVKELDSLWTQMKPGL